jgi:hypothetical protein
VHAHGPRQAESSETPYTLSESHAVAGCESRVGEPAAATRGGAAWDFSLLGSPPTPPRFGTRVVSIWLWKPLRMWGCRAGQGARCRAANRGVGLGSRDRVFGFETDDVWRPLAL